MTMVISHDGHGYGDAETIMLLIVAMTIALRLGALCALSSSKCLIYFQVQDRAL